MCGEERVSYVALCNGHSVSRGCVCRRRYGLVETPRLMWIDSDPERALKRLEFR